MKQPIFIFVLSFFAAIQLFAQVPQKINYQAVARTPDGVPIADQAVTVKFRVLQGSANGSEVFTETHPQIPTDDCGMFNLKIGGANPAAFDQINWSTGSKWLEVTINNAVIGTTEMLSVPYALYAERSGMPEIYIFEERYDHGVVPTTHSSTNGKPVSNGYNTRKLNTAVYSTPNSDNVSLNASSGIITFKPGTYLIEASAPAFYVYRHKLFLRTINNADLLRGTDEYSRAEGGSDQTRSFIKGVIVVTGSDQLVRLDHYISTADVNTGGIELGVENSVSTSGINWNTIPEVYSTIMIQKIK